jgi:hypothetical protein
MELEEKVRYLLSYLKNTHHQLRYRMKEEY